MIIPYGIEREREREEEIERKKGGKHRRAAETGITREGSEAGQG